MKIGELKQGNEHGESWARLRDELQTLTLFIPFLTKKPALSYTRYWLMVPLSHN